MTGVAREVVYHHWAVLVMQSWVGARTFPPFSPLLERKVRLDKAPEWGKVGMEEKGAPVAHEVLCTLWAESAFCLREQKKLRKRQHLNWR